ncbi:MAG: hypothetical protein WA740_19505 [Candidatus Binataceae bacterium]
MAEQLGSRGIVTKSFATRVQNRVLHQLARILPGSRSVRPRLHRRRGVVIGSNVFIGDDVYIENEYPECVQIGDNVEIALRTVIIAHLRGPGGIVIERDVWIGACCLISCVSDRILTIGEGAVIGAGSVITSDVAAHAFVRPAPSGQVATAAVPLAIAPSYFAFFRGLRPVRARGVGADPGSGSEVH